MSVRMLLVGGALVASASFAEAAGPLHAGIDGGMNIASAESDNRIEGASSDSRIGILIGARVRYQIDPMISVGAGLALDQKGEVVDLRNTSLVPIEETKARYNYLTVPLFLRVDLAHGKMVPFVEVGPEVGFLLSAKARVESSGAPARDEDVKDLDDLDLGAGLGAGLEAPVGGYRVGLAVGYALGVRNILDDSDSGGEYKNRAIRVSLRVGI